MGRMRILSSWLGVISVVAVTIGAPVRAPVTVPMSQYDYGRTGANLQESILNPSNVDPAHFGKLFWMARIVVRCSWFCSNVCTWA